MESNQPQNSYSKTDEDILEYNITDLETASDMTSEEELALASSKDNIRQRMKNAKEKTELKKIQTKIDDKNWGELKTTIAVQGSVLGLGTATSVGVEIALYAAGVTQAGTIVVACSGVAAICTIAYGTWEIRKSWLQQKEYGQNMKALDDEFNSMTNNNTDLSQVEN